MVLYSKAFRNCGAVLKRVLEAEEYEYPNNFERSSKRMEASTILKTVEDAFYNRFFIIYVIVSDNDSTKTFCAQASIQRCPRSSSEVIQSKTL